MRRSVLVVGGLLTWMVNSGGAYMLCPHSSHCAHSAVHIFPSAVLPPRPRTNTRCNCKGGETSAELLRVISQDRGILAINKRFGQRMDGNYEATVQKLVLQRADVDKFRPIHQLDFATSGVLLLGTDKKSAARARKAWDSGRVRKTYLAILEGRMDTHEAWVDAPIAVYEGSPTLPPRGEAGTHGGARDFRMMVGTGGSGIAGKAAQTRVVCLGHGVIHGQEVSKVAMFPVTGRRHQLRLHAAHLGLAILGDWTYGNRLLAESLPRMYLHAWTLEMEHADGEASQRWTTPDPFPDAVFDSFVALASQVLVHSKRLLCAVDMLTSLEHLLGAATESLRLPARSLTPCKDVSGRVAEASSSSVHLDLRRRWRDRTRA